MCVTFPKSDNEKKRLLKDVPSEILVYRKIEQHYGEKYPLFMQSREPNSALIGKHKAGNYPKIRTTMPRSVAPGFCLNLNLPIKFNHLSASVDISNNTKLQLVKVRKKDITSVVSFGMQQTGIICSQIEVLDPNEPIIKTTNQI